jgi:hypothetical protein
MNAMRVVFACICCAVAAPVMADKYQDTISNFNKADIAKEYFRRLTAMLYFPL